MFPIIALTIQAFFTGYIVLDLILSAIVFFLYVIPAYQKYKLLRGYANGTISAGPVEDDETFEVNDDDDDDDFDSGFDDWCRGDDDDDNDCGFDDDDYDEVDFDFGDSDADMPTNDDQYKSYMSEEGKASAKDLSARVQSDIAAYKKMLTNDKREQTMIKKYGVPYAFMLGKNKTE